MKLVDAIRKNLTPDLLSDAWASRITARDPKSAGHCYIAAEVAYHMYGKQHGYKPFCISADGWTHWFLKNKKTGDIIDPTADQFSPDDPPYDLGVGRGFLTRHPSKRAQILIARVNGYYA